jgi:hypothetical protein
MAPYPLLMDSLWLSHPTKSISQLFVTGKKEKWGSIALPRPDACFFFLFIFASSCSRSSHA